MARSLSRLQIFAGVVAAFAISAAVFSCAAVVGFPDRVLDEQAEGGPGETPIPPGVNVSKPTIDFGLVPCGGAAPTPQPITISNGTSAPVTWTAKLSDTPDFSISSATTGVLAPNTVATITITAQPVPQTAQAGGATEAVLTITTDSAAQPKLDVPIKLAFGGGTLSLVPSSVDFGESSVNKPAADIPVTLKNTGNQSVLVDLGVLNDPQFVLTWAGAPAPVTLAPAASIQGLLAKFTPTKVSAATATSAITVTGALCGSNPTSISLSGKGSPSDASVQPGTLDFGLVDCGGTAPAQTVTIVNAGSKSFIWNAALLKGGSSSFTLSKATATLAGNTSEQITVTPKAIPSSTEVTPNLYGDTLTITTDANADVPHVIDLRMTAQGVILAPSGPAINFNSVRINTTELAPLSITNSGNVQANVTCAVSTPSFAITPPSSVISAGANYVFSASFTPTEQKTYNDLATISVVGNPVLCKPLPPAITLTGNGATSATLTPTNVSFGAAGSVKCGVQAAAQTVTLTNIGTASFTWTASVATANYTIAPASGSLAPNGFASISVTPIQIPTTSSVAADLYADTLTVQTTPTLESPFIAYLHMTAKGAIFAFSPPSIDFGNVVNGGSTSKPLTVTNNGNANGDLTFATTGPANTFSITPLTKTLGAGNSFNASVKFAPKTTGAQTGSVTVTSAATLCAPLPTPVTTLSGNGT